MALSDQQAPSGGHFHGPASWRRWAKRGLARKVRRFARLACLLRCDDIPRRYPVRGYAD